MSAKNSNFCLKCEEHMMLQAISPLMCLNNMIVVHKVYKVTSLSWKLIVFFKVGGQKLDYEPFHLGIHPRETLPAFFYPLPLPSLPPIRFVPWMMQVVTPERPTNSRGKISRYLLSLSFHLRVFHSLYLSFYVICMLRRNDRYYSCIIFIISQVFYP